MEELKDQDTEASNTKPNKREIKKLLKTNNENMVSTINTSVSTIGNYAHTFTSTISNFTA
jgi:hypothetical protein